ncbi:hypothetical protein PHYBLDRAFT_167049 [Phycomyces blakesleeanus NRRL 1555(-)]|uniref:Uncharacterized protein n=1 Tax=Phycomyces blakesleeanus (strain ATCC 8743b / DSM 1359 / FGSC 10004 / NBRC 33097 / NRRL 1555) TaxID=763407 RepID=A0A167N0L4_PHYB8|nr:hypothetical protein PHYBLDRAFT_167049 [Phycomyces blakesleeanus NRRL 1555(-)]OAD74699.1 hypothetical protein PHYBLDRAFT_167049 [Phycomyces blakesleeanus NRRL 1555(-)]|eukprot:XP_018292739.1 hypothetical protein PHYBLDRAFT_167049 [Phycomyces blakesleeanus NRRL 1555(-)]
MVSMFPRIVSSIWIHGPSIFVANRSLMSFIRDGYHKEKSIDTRPKSQSLVSLFINDNSSNKYKYKNRIQRDKVLFERVRWGCIVRSSRFEHGPQIITIILDTERRKWEFKDTKAHFYTLKLFFGFNARAPTLCVERLIQTRLLFQLLLYNNKIKPSQNKKQSILLLGESNDV